MKKDTLKKESTRATVSGMRTEQLNRAGGRVARKQLPISHFGPVPTGNLNPLISPTPKHVTPEFTQALEKLDRVPQPFVFQEGAPGYVVGP